MFTYNVLPHTGKPTTVSPVHENPALNLTEGSKFNHSCKLNASEFRVAHTVACVTRNTSATLEELSSATNLKGNCAHCDSVGGRCTQFNSNLTDIAVHTFRSDEDHCRPVLLTNFEKDSVSLSDSGIRILCGYEEHEVPTSYASIYLNVKPKRNILVVVLVPTLSALIILVLVLLSCLVTTRYLYKKRHRSKLQAISTSAQREGMTLCFLSVFADTTQYIIIS